MGEVKNMWEGLKQMLAEIIFPVYCVDCGAEGSWWCAECRKNIVWKSNQACPLCGKNTERGEACADCLAVTHLDGVAALFNYEEKGTLGRMIKLLKYNFASDSVGIWREIFSAASANYFPEATAIIPVPLHLRRQRERGFNQSQLLARELLAARPELNWQLDSTGLRRRRHTIQQAKLSGVDRRKNLLAAFEWQSANSVPEQVIVFDDVFTTGATMQECAKVLKQHGARTVWGLAVARG